MSIKIAYLTHQDPTDKRSWSGIHYNMYQGLKDQGFEVTPLGPVNLNITLILRTLGFISRVFLRRRYLPEHSLWLSKKYGRIFKKRIKELQPDVIFAANASTEIAHLEKGNIPVIYLSGGTFNLLENYYESFSNPFKFVSRNGNLIEQNAIDKATAVVYPTNWAAHSAKKDYGATEDKVHVIPYGANAGFKAPVKKSKQLDPDSIRLLLVGVRWEGKGAPIAIEVVNELRERGINATLDICGCEPPQPLDEDGVTIHGFLDKRKPEEAQKLERLYSEANFFILPTRYENFGVSFVEAFAAGLPCLGTNTGGVPTIIQPGKNGYLFELSDGGKAYADKIEEIVNIEDHYAELSRNARASYEETFNWDVWGNRIAGVVKKAAGKTDDE